MNDQFALIYICTQINVFTLIEILTWHMWAEGEWNKKNHEK